MAGGGSPVGETSFFGAFVIVCNLIMGTGLLALPQAFFDAGYVLGPLTMLFFAFCAYTSLYWLFEAQVHCFVLDRLFRRGYLQLKDDSQDAEKGSLVAGVSRTSLLEALKISPSATLVVNSSVNRGDFDRAIDYDALDRGSYLQIADTIRILCGPKWSVAFIVNQILNMFFVMWAYTCILAGTAVIGIPIVGLTSRLECDTSSKTSFVDHPDCKSGVRLFLAIYWVTNSFLTCRNWRFIETAQKAVTVIANVSIVAMVITASVALTTAYYPGTNVAPSNTTNATAVPSLFEHVSLLTDTAPSTDPPNYAQHVPTFNWGKFGKLFGVAVFCLLCHPAATYAFQNMPTKEAIRKVLLLAFGVLVILYIIVAEVVSWYMGEKTEDPVTLNWSQYYEWGSHTGFGQALGGFLLFYPMFTVNAAATLQAEPW